MKATAREIVIKTLFNADEYSAFKDACNDADVSQSKKLRELAAHWVTQRNDKRRARRLEWPAGGQNRAMLLPGRARYAATRMCLRQ